MNEIEKQILKNQLYIMRALHYNPRTKEIDESLRENGNATKLLLNPKQEKPINEQTKDALLGEHDA